MKIDKNSPFYKIPVNLEPKQIAILNAIRYATNLSFISWNQLNTVLLQISKSKAIDEEKYYAFSYTWSIVDSLDRLNSLISKFINGLNNPFDTVPNLRLLRNTLHHSYDRIDASLQIKYPIMGTLDWVYSEEYPLTMVYCYKLASGNAAANFEFESINPVGKQITLPIGLVTLTSIIMDTSTKPSEPKPASIDLSQLMMNVEAYIKNLEKNLQNELAGLGSSNNTELQDLLIGYEIHFDQSANIQTLY